MGFEKPNFNSEKSDKELSHIEVLQKAMKICQSKIDGMDKALSAGQDDFYYDFAENFEGVKEEIKDLKSRKSLNIPNIDTLQEKIDNMDEMLSGGPDSSSYYSIADEFNKLRDAFEEFKKWAEDF